MEETFHEQEVFLGCVVHSFAMYSATACFYLDASPAPKCEESLAAGGIMRGIQGDKEGAPKHPPLPKADLPPISYWLARGKQHIAQLCAEIKEGLPILMGVHSNKYLAYAISSVIEIELGMRASEVSFVSGRFAGSNGLDPPPKTGD